MPGLTTPITTTSSSPIETALVKNADGSAIANPTYVDGTAAGTAANGQKRWLCAVDAPAGTYPAGAQKFRVKGSTAASDSALSVTAGVVVAGSAPVNQPPVAAAGSDATITLPTNQATLTGSGSDPDGTVASHNWTQVSGPNAATLATPAMYSTSASGLVAGTYVFRLTVTDDKNAIATDDVQLTVNAAPTPGGKPVLLVALGNSQTYGYRAGGGASATTPPGEGDNSWPDQLLAMVPAGSLEIHNEGVSGQDWSALDGRVAGLAQYFSAGTKANYSRRIVLLQEGTNTAWHGGANGVVNATNAKAVVDHVRTLGSDIETWLFTAYPFRDTSGGVSLADSADIDARLTQFNNILLDIDATNSANIGLYAALDKVLNARTADAMKDADATADTEVWADGVHLLQKGNYLIAQLVKDALASSQKRVDSTYVFPAPDPNAPYGTPQAVALSQVQGVGPTSSSGNYGGFFYSDGAAGYFKVAFNRGIQYVQKTPYNGVCEIFLNGVSQGQFGPVAEGATIYEYHPNGGANRIEIHWLSGYVVMHGESLTRWVQ